MIHYLPNMCGQELPYIHKDHKRKFKNVGKYFVSKVNNLC